MQIDLGNDAIVPGKRDRGTSRSTCLIFFFIYIHIISTFAEMRVCWAHSHAALFRQLWIFKVASIWQFRRFLLFVFETFPATPLPNSSCLLLLSGWLSAIFGCVRDASIVKRHFWRSRRVTHRARERESERLMGIDGIVSSLCPQVNQLNDRMVPAINKWPPEDTAGVSDTNSGEMLCQEPGVSCAYTFLRSLRDWSALNAGGGGFLPFLSVFKAKEPSRDT